MPASCAAVASDGLNTTLLYRDDEAAEFRPLITTDYRTSVHPAFFTFDDKKLYAQSNRGRDKLALVVIDPARPDVEEEIYAPQEVDLDAAAYSRKRRVLTLAVYQTDKPQYKFFDAQTETLFKKLTAKLPGYDLALQGRTAMRTSSSSPPTTTARRARDTCTTPPRTH